MFIDSHAHLTGDDLCEKAGLLIKRACAEGVQKIVNICTDRSSLDKGIEICRQHPGVIFNTGSTTPHDVQEDGEDDFPIFEAAARGGSLVAIGETGLDYHYEHSPRDRQRCFCERYVELGVELGLPVVFHCRDAFEDLLSIVDELASGHPFLIHCFTGEYKEAKAVIDRGGLISFSGILTFKKSTELRDVAKRLPLDRVVIETDAPYLAPQSRRGKQNEPAFVTETAQVLADVLGVDITRVASVTSSNSERFFQLVS